MTHFANQKAVLMNCFTKRGEEKE